MSPLAGLGLASTASAGRLVPGTRNEVWLCQAYAGGRGIVLYVKPALEQRALFVEALAAQLGQCLRLPCPNPYLVTVNPLHVGRPKGKAILAFGSEEVGRLARSINDIDTLMRAVEKAGVAEMACVFDEWIANPVRGPGDVLIDPGRGVAFIDHECAMETLTQPEAATTNWLALQLINRLADGKRAQFLKALRARANGARRAALDEPPSVVQVSQDGVQIYRGLLKFLVDRLVHLDRLLSLRVLPEQAYLSDTPTTNDPDRAANV